MEFSRQKKNMSNLTTLVEKACFDDIVENAIMKEEMEKMMPGKLNKRVCSPSRIEVDLERQRSEKPRSAKVHKRTWTVQYDSHKDSKYFSKQENKQQLFHAI